MSPPDNDDFRVALARIEGRLGEIATTIEAGDRNSAQLVEMLKGELTHLREALREDRQRHHDDMESERLARIAGHEKLDMAISVVRHDTKAYTDEQVAGVRRSVRDLEPKVDALRLGWAKLTGIAIVASACSSLIIAALIKGAS